jgi:hypothetical protein
MMVFRFSCQLAAVPPFGGSFAGQLPSARSDLRDLFPFGGGENPLWSNNGRELFYKSEEHRFMVVDYVVNGDSFIAGKPRIWSDKQCPSRSLLAHVTSLDGVPRERSRTT